MQTIFLRVLQIFVDRFGKRRDFMIFLQSFIRRLDLVYIFYDPGLNLEAIFGYFQVMQGFNKKAFR